MFKKVAFAGLATALLFGAIPAHAGMQLNGVRLNGMQLNGAGTSGVRGDETGTDTTAQVRVVSVKLPREPR
jgi:hypothetical protein